MDINRARAIDHTLGNSIGKSVPPAWPAADNQLRRVDRACVFQQRAGDVVADEHAPLAIEIFHQLLQTAQRGRGLVGGQTLVAGDVDRHHFSARNSSCDTGGAPNECFGPVAARHRYDEALAGRPCRVDLVVLAVGRETFFDLVSQPQQRQFAQGSQVSQAEVVLQGLGRHGSVVDLAPREPDTQRVGG